MKLKLIRSASNPRIKSAIRRKESRIRRRENLFLVDGVREIFRAWQSNWHFHEVFISLGRSSIPEGAEEIEISAVGEPQDRHYRELNDFLVELLEENVPVWGVPETLFSKIGFGDRNERILAVLEGQALTFEEFGKRLPENPLIGVLEGIEKPGNIGAVFRSADGAGVDGIVIAAPGTDLYNPNAIRSSLGTIFRIPTVLASSEEAVEWLLRSRIQIASAICDARVPYTYLDYTGPTAIVLGNEADGLLPLWSEDRLSEVTCPISLPMLGIADSLNVSNAAAILFYEARRQRFEENRVFKE